MTGTGRLRSTIRIGIAHWGFGNLYEEVVRMPERVAERPAPSGSPLGPGEPARYFLPAGPLTVAAAVVDAARTREPAAAVTALALLGAAAVSGHLIRTVNVPLLRGEVAPADTARTTARWHRWNRGRLALLGVAAVGAALR